MSFVEDIVTNPQDTILFVTLLVGVCSIVITALTLYWQREHDHLMVRPIGKFHTEGTDLEYSLRIENNGLGPLLVKSIEIDRRDGDRLITENWPPKVFKTPTPHLGICTITQGVEHLVINPGFVVYLFQNKMTNRDDPQQLADRKTKVAEMSGFLEIRLKYTDIYGKQTWTETATTNTIIL